MPIFLEKVSNNFLILRCINGDNIILHYFTDCCIFVSKKQFFNCNNALKLSLTVSYITGVNSFLIHTCTTDSHKSIGNGH